MTVLYRKTHYGFLGTRFLIWVVLVSSLGVFMTDESQAVDGPVVAKATFGGGCFWCTEAVYAEIRGVKSVTSGYTGGRIPNPNYKQVCSGLTGHAEGVEIQYDPTVVPFEKLLEIFFATHDPTTLNRQGRTSVLNIGQQFFITTVNRKRLLKMLSRNSMKRMSFPRLLSPRWRGQEFFTQPKTIIKTILPTMGLNRTARQLLLPRWSKYVRLSKNS